MSTQVERQPVAARRNGAGTTALVTGVVALVLAVLIIFFPLAAIIGVIAAIFGFVGLGRANRGEADNKNHAIAGIVTGLLALVLAVYMTFRLGSFVAEHEGDFRSFWRCITSAPTKAEQNDCGEQLARALEGEHL